MHEIPVFPHIYTSLTKSLYIPMKLPLKLAISIMSPGLFHSTAMPQEGLELGLWGEQYLNFSPWFSFVIPKL